jgi:membrane-bound lytic murein transglycosylase D
MAASAREAVQGEASAKEEPLFEVDQQKDHKAAYIKPPAILVSKELAPEAGSQAQRAVREAEKHFQYGKFFLQESKTAEARGEFDQAIDVLLDVPESVADRSIVEKKFEELIRVIHRYDVDSLGSGISPESPVFVQSTLPEILDMTFPIDPRLKDKALAQVAATSSQLPLTVNDAVLSYINYFTSERGRKVIYFGLKRAGKYRAMISRILDEEGVPQELIHLAQAESGFVPRAVSRAAATGMWQFIRSRGTEYGLESSNLYDQRLDPEKATRAAAKHLRDLYSQLGDWYLAMAAYNCGPYCVERAVQRTGYADFWTLRARSVLPRETMNYVPAILAMAIVSKNLQAYGLEPVDPDPTLEYDSVKVTSATNLGLIADAADVPPSEIRDLNPSLLKNLAPQGYDVRVPKSKGNTVLAALEAVPADKRGSWRLHRVGEGDTLASIAKRYSTAAGSIVTVNSRLDSAFFESPENGEVLLIPASTQPEPSAARTARKGTAKRGYVQSARTVRKSNGARVTSVSAQTRSRKPISR